ncbi:MAG: AMP-binding protein [Micromonosporaceae bacterium]
MILFPALDTAADRTALRFGEQVVSYRELDAWTAQLADPLRSASRVAVWAEPRLETVVAIVAALRAGTPAAPLNPKAGQQELAHILADSDPDLVLAAPGTKLPVPASDRRQLAVEPRAGGDQPDAASTGKRPGEPAVELPGEAAALIIYTSGTTGPPKGVVLPRRAIATNLDGLAEAWRWTETDTVAHALPLFHVHGLILGMLGPLRRGGAAWHIGPFSAQAAAAALRGGATMMFGVPTMWHRLADAVEVEPEVAAALRRARLLVSGSAPLPVVDQERIAAATGQQVIQRYGLTETLMNSAERADGDTRAGAVGPPLPSVEVELIDEDGHPVSYDEVGEILVRGPNLFLEYLNRPEATAEVMRDGWFHTGDMATRSADGYLRIVGRKATDLIKSGGFKIGAGEIENALLDHPTVAEVAVTAAADPDLGERVVAWVVPAAGQPQPELESLADWVAAQLAPHKRPRELRLLDRLPRNEMGKVLKRELIDERPRR